MIASRTHPDTTPGSMACAPLTEPVIAILHELRDVLAMLSDEQYVVRMGPLFADATVGGHVRHCLDHVRALVLGQPVGLIDYDRRERGTAIESSLFAASRSIADLISALQNLSPLDASEPLSVAIMPSRQGDSLLLVSTLGRELTFVLSHTIHHNSTIRGMVISLGLPIPANFGYAPSTIAHQDRLQCAR